MLRSIPILLGPTGSGKTAVALAWARRTDGEIISADSRQIYRRLSVGTAKPRGRWIRRARLPENAYEVEGVPHHLMDILEPTEVYSAGLFARQAEEILGLLSSSSTPALVVGGTGLYLRALTDGLAPLPSRDEALRNELLEKARQEGRAALHQDLARVDPAAAGAIPVNNIARVVRALEVFRLTGRPLSWWQKEKTRPSPFSFQWFGLQWPKDRLEKNLADRCRAMVRRGLLEETSALLEKGVSPSAPAFQALGYDLAVDRLKGRLSSDDFESRFIHQTRLYAKRQMTWFRANRRIRWLPVPDPLDPDALAEKIKETAEKDIPPQ
jgi:tRNA dimethylallyltransferase